MSLFHDGFQTLDLLGMLFRKVASFGNVAAQVISTLREGAQTVLPA